MDISMLISTLNSLVHRFHFVIFLSVLNKYEPIVTSPILKPWVCITGATILVYCNQNISQWLTYCNSGGTWFRVVPLARKNGVLPGHKVSGITAKQYTKICVWKYRNRQSTNSILICICSALPSLTVWSKFREPCVMNSLRLTCQSLF